MKHLVQVFFIGLAVVLTLATITSVQKSMTTTSDCTHIEQEFNYRGEILDGWYCGNTIYLYRRD